MTPPTQTLDAAWQAALATEYAAVFYYGAFGPQLTDPGHIALARTFEEQHRELRDRTAAALLAAGQSPAPPQTDYPLPFSLAGSVDAQRLALATESGCAAAWRYLVTAAASGPAPSGLRQAASDALTASAIRATRWRSILHPAEPTVPFPGS
jgi:Domain of unknown function (DUF4439)